MELKRPFTEEDWEATPKPVRQYIIQLEDIVVKLFKETEDLKKRVSDLENRLNKNSQNSSKPPSSDPPYKKPTKKRVKGKRNRGGQKGHKGHQQKLMKPSSKTNLFPETCACGVCCIDPKSIKPFYTHQVIELPEIKMDVQHFILNQGTCSQCGGAAKASLPKKHQTGYGPRLSALIAEVSGIQGNSRETVRTFCQSVFGFSISSGAIQKVIDRASRALKPVHEKIGDSARTSEANYIDETSWFQNGILNWLWVMTNNRVAYFMIHKNRSKKAFMDLVQDWEGLLISDNYRAPGEKQAIFSVFILAILFPSDSIDFFKNMYKTDLNFNILISQNLALQVKNHALYVQNLAYWYNKISRYLLRGSEHLGAIIKYWSGHGGHSIISRHCTKPFLGNATVYIQPSCPPNLSNL